MCLPAKMQESTQLKAITYIRSTFDLVQATAAGTQFAFSPRAGLCADASTDFVFRY